MPELPEVETLCRQLRTRIIDERIEAAAILDSKLEIPDGVEGRRAISVKRLGKWIFIGLDDSRMLEIHLRMTGRLLWQKAGTKPPPHSRFVLDFSSGRMVMVDPRRFATLSLVENDSRRNAAVDALNPRCAEVLIVEGCSRKRPLKSFLLDQKIIGGIGNIYACEILHRVGLNPRRKTAGLSPEDWRKIESATAAVLLQAIECRGTSISDWRDLFGEKGEYQKELRVYGREGEKCVNCGAVIRRELLLGRGTWFCPGCQT